MVRKAELITQDDDITEFWEAGNGPTSSGDDRTDAEKKTDAIADALQTDVDAFINVSRQNSGGNQPMEFVGRYAADKFDFGQLQSHLQKNYGGGDYRCMLYANGKVRANKLLSIAETIKPNNQPTQTGELSGMFLQMMDRMDKQNQQMVELIRGQQTGGLNRADMLQEMALYKQLFSPTGNSGGDMVGQMRDLMGLQKELTLGLPQQNDDSDSFGGLLEKLTPLIEAAVSTPKQQPQQNPQQAQQNQQAAQMNFALKMGIGQLLKAAEKNSDHGTYAEFVIDNVPEPAIRKLILAPDSLRQLTQVNPNIARFSEWFLLLGEHVKAQLGLPSTVSAEYVDDDLTPEPVNDNVSAKSTTEKPPINDQPTDV